MANVWIRYGIGFDMSKDSFSACIRGLNSEDVSKIIASRKFSNTAKGFTAAKAWVEAKCKVKTIPCRMLLEVTGVYHESFLYFLDEAGYYVSLELGKRTKSYLKSLGNNSKTDKIDASGLASMALHRKLPQWKPISQEMYHIRQLVRFRNSLVTSNVALKNQLHAYNHMHRAHQEIMRSLTRKIKQTDKEIKAIEKRIKTLLQEDEALWKRIETILDSLLGVGLTTLATVIAETDGFQIIESAKQLTKYAGYDIVERQSGAYKGKSTISKQGNARLRTAMYMPAMAHLRMKKGPLFALYKRLIQRNGGLKKKAGVAVQRKLLCLIYSLWKSGQEYDPNYHLKQQTYAANDNQNGSSPDIEPGLHEIVQHEAELLTRK